MCVSKTRDRHDPLWLVVTSLYVVRPAGASGDSCSWEDRDHGTSEQVPAGAAERAVRMVAEVRPDYDSQWAAICAVSGKLGIGSAETLRTWIRRAEVDSGRVPGVTSEQAEELKRLKRENARAAPCQ